MEYRKYIKTTKNDCFHCFSEKFQNENDFKAVIATFCSDDYGANSSEAVEEMAAGRKKLSKMLLVCYSLLHRQSISSILLITLTVTVKKVGYWHTPSV